MLDFHSGCIDNMVEIIKQYMGGSSFQLENP